MLTILLSTLCVVLAGSSIFSYTSYKREKSKNQVADDIASLKNDLANYRKETEANRLVMSEIQSERLKLSTVLNDLVSAKNIQEKTLVLVKSEVSKAQEELDAIKNQSQIEADKINKLQQVEKQFIKSQKDLERLQQEVAEQKILKIGAEKAVQDLQINLQRLNEENLVEQRQKDSAASELSSLNRLIAEKKNSTVTAKRNVTVITPLAEEQPRGDIKHIGYEPNNVFLQNSLPHYYPFVCMPKPNSVIKFPRRLTEGRIGIRGYKETAFDAQLSYYFKEKCGLQFHNDRFLFISDNTKPYVPDHILIDERSNFNLFLDIEIDEPYDGLSRFPMHESGVDKYRNYYFNNRGWIVIRFAEIQVHKNILGCCKFVAQVIKSILPSFVIHLDLQQVEDIFSVPLWNKLQAEKWSKGKYREKYLQIPGFGARESFTVDTSKLKANKDDLSTEQRVDEEPLVFEETSLRCNIRNAHPRDNRLKFNRDQHIYLIDNNANTISGTTFIRKFFPEFDGPRIAPFSARKLGLTPEEVLTMWEMDGLKAANEGIALHHDIERFFDNSSFTTDKKEFQHFLDFYSALGHLELHRTEWRIFDDVLMIAGTADAVFKKKDGSFVIYDWKRSKEIKKSGYRDYNSGITQKGYGVCSIIEDCNHSHYSIQLNLYKKILEDHYFGEGYVSEMYFVQLHPVRGSYEVFEVPNMKSTIDSMYEELLTLR